MGALTNIQWRLVTPAEVGTDDPMSVRSWRDIAWSVNNAKYHGMRDKVRTQACFPGWDTPDTITDEYCLLDAAPVIVPDGYTHVLLYIGHYRFAGSDNITWTLYVDSGIYYGPQYPFDTSKLSSGYKSVSFTCSSDTHDIDTVEVELVKDANLWECCFMLTGTNGDASTRGRITTIDAVPF